ncbi:DUF3710 domain-containing protein [Nocardioides sp.]|uniref:DUF3710 domain-containing protein n=1 Tax=Nocardioides sp. TaxID=35761 RepID=UPI0035132FA7
MRIRRKKDDATTPEGVDAAGTGSEAAEEGAGDAQSAEVRAAGPLDVDEAEDGVERVDLGSLLVAPEAGRELRLQVDERTNTVQAVLLASEDGAVEFRAFAAPRNGDLWTEVRPQIAADMQARGGRTSEREGPFGIELVCTLPVQGEQENLVQPSRIVGVNGPRWLLRATFLGKPAMEPEAAAEWEDVLRRVVVRRGGAPMPVGEPLPLTLPDSARRVGPA